jgi:hypothetical protein
MVLVALAYTFANLINPTYSRTCFRWAVLKHAFKVVNEDAANKFTDAAAYWLQSLSSQLF